MISFLRDSVSSVDSKYNASCIANCVLLDFNTCMSWTSNPAEFHYSWLTYLPIYNLHLHFSLYLIRFIKLFNYLFYIVSFTSVTICLYLYFIIPRLVWPCMIDYLLYFTLLLLLHLSNVRYINFTMSHLNIYIYNCQFINAHSHLFVFAFVSLFASWSFDLCYAKINCVSQFV